MTVEGDLEQLAALPDNIAPVVSCRPGIGQLIRTWQRSGRPFIYWDRGYMLRGGKTWLSVGDYWRMHRNAVQLPAVRPSCGTRLKALGITPQPWRKDGKHIVLTDHGNGYKEFHRCKTWLRETYKTLRKATDRPIVVRPKEDREPLQEALQGAHCLVSHGSNAAVEAVILGCPVFVNPISAAASVGRTDMDIENPVYPDRMPWLMALADSQFTSHEIRNGTALRCLA